MIPRRNRIPLQNYLQIGIKVMTGINCSSRSAAWGKKNYPYGSVSPRGGAIFVLKNSSTKGNKAMITVYPARLI
jgi:hypothetical protein